MTRAGAIGFMIPGLIMYGFDWILRIVRYFTASTTTLSFTQVLIHSLIIFFERSWNLRFCLWSVGRQSLSCGGSEAVQVQGWAVRVDTDPSSVPLAMASIYHLVCTPRTDYDFPHERHWRLEPPSHQTWRQGAHRQD